MIYLKIIWAWLLSLKSKFQEGQILELRESSHRQRDLVRNAKMVKETKKIRISFSPFSVEIDRVRIYDKFDKVNVDNKNVSIIMENKNAYKTIPHAPTSN